MHTNNDEDIRRILRSMAIPEPSSNLEHRIITSAKRQNVAQKSQQHWWQSIFAPGLALAASLVIMATIWLGQPEVILPSAQENQNVEQQMASAHISPNMMGPFMKEDPKTVYGVPLLADIDLVVEPELEMEALLLSDYQG